MHAALLVGYTFDIVSTAIIVFNEVDAPIGECAPPCTKRVHCRTAAHP